MSGQVPALVQAGHRAPTLTWTKIIASTTSSGGPQALAGQTTVLLFLRPVSHNENTLSSWNELVEQFRDQPVNFVWIANEGEESLRLFLKSHTVRGWMVLDPQEGSYKAYGVDGAAGVLINSHGIVAGFTFMTPQKDEIQAVLDGRAIAIKGDPSEAQLDDIFDGTAVRLEAEPFRSPPLPQKPNLPRSEDVHISLSQTKGTIGSSGPDHWMQRGFDLRAILSKVLATNPSRIGLPAALDNGTRYDFVLVPAHEEDQETMNRHVLEGLEKYFHMSITPEIRFTNVYVMTAVGGKIRPKKAESESFVGSVTFSSKWRDVTLPEGTPPTRKALEEAMASPEFRTAIATAELTAMTAVSSSMDDFRRALEDGLHRPIIDETKLTGIYDFSIQGEAQCTDEFLSMLRDQLGLELTPTQRNIEMTVVRLVE